MAYIPKIINIVTLARISFLSSSLRILTSVNSFSPSSSSIGAQHRAISYNCDWSCRFHPPTKRLVLLHSKIIDAEFINDGDDSAESLMTLIEYSQNQDPDWKSMPIAFCDSSSNTYIDCTLAFYVRDGDDEYALGVPCETPIVVALEIDEDDETSMGNSSLTQLSKVFPINPDNFEATEDDIDPQGGDDCYNIGQDEKEEIFQIAARELMREFGSNIKLKRTPRVLTVEGDLDKVIGDWKDSLISTSKVGRSQINLDDAIKLFADDSDDGEDYFDMIMKRDLGPDYMKFAEDDDEIDEDILKLFDIAENMDWENDVVEGLINNGVNDFKGQAVDEVFLQDNLLQELPPTAALKLLSFLGPGEKEFTVLRPLRPILLVGREDSDDYTRRILLSEAEKRNIMPKLEVACKKELEQAGFILNGAGAERSIL